MAGQAAEETPTLKATIDAGVDYWLTELHTAMPAQVVSYAPATGFAVVQPSIKRIYKDGRAVDLPKIINVPVCFPRAGKAYLHLPLKKNDCVLLVFSERSIDVWKTNGGKVDPKDTRKHHLTDAYAIPGGYPKATPIEPAPSSDDLELTHDQMVLILKAAGKLQLKAGENELYGIICDLFQEIQLGQNGMGPLVMPGFAVLKAKLDAAREAT